MEVRLREIRSELFFIMACPSAMSTVWSAVNVLEGFVLSLSWKTSPCGGAWTEAESEGV